MPSSNHVTERTVCRVRSQLSPDAGHGPSDECAQFVHDARNVATCLRAIARRADAGVLGQHELADLVGEIATKLAHQCDDYVVQDRAEVRDPTADASDVISSVASALRPLASEHGIAIEVVREARCQAAIVPAALYRATMNLALNAVQAMAPRRRGTVTLTVRSVHDLALVEVKDDGPGLPIGIAQDLTAADREPRCAQGRGLGLRSALTLVDAAGGQLRLSSSSRTGSAFSIRLLQRV